MEHHRGIDLFALAQHRHPEGEGRDAFISELDAGASFDNEFVGASYGECQSWALQQFKENKALNDELIAIADERSAEDGTIVMQFYAKGPPPVEGVSLKSDSWYLYRIRYQDAFDICAALTETAPDVTYPVYFGRKEEFTDEDGVFDVQKAREASVSQ